MKTFQARDALFIVDPQIDFFPSGALPVPAGDQIMSVLNQLIAETKKTDTPIFVSRDWHPLNHCSFKSEGGIWPPHCIQNTAGAQFHPDLKLPTHAVLINKAFTEKTEAYSAFEGELESGESLADYLRAHHIECLWMGGLALDYCVKATALDALKSGFNVNLVLDATRAISEEMAKAALDEMAALGAQLV